MLLLTAFLSSAVQAAPPPEGSEDWEIMRPYADWIQHQNGPMGWCCDVADGRPVDARMTESHWQVRLLHSEALPNAPPGWVDVPDDALLHGQNPTGFPIAWFYHGGVRCFIPGSAT
jgi:hypothetical protein